jgi:excisionase family DNA binding protein
MSILAVPKLYTEQEAAAALQMSPDKLQRLRRRGSVPYRQIGNRVRYTESDINEFLDRCRENVCPQSKPNREAMEPIGLVNATEAQTGIALGSTPALDKPAASRLARLTFGKPTNDSQLGSWKTDQPAMKNQARS